MPLLVCGAHLSAMPLHQQLVERGATLREATTTSEGYRLWALPGGLHPGLVRHAEGVPIEVEVRLAVWSVRVCACDYCFACLRVPTFYARPYFGVSFKCDARPRLSF